MTMDPLRGDQGKALDERPVVKSVSEQAITLTASILVALG